MLFFGNDTKNGGWQQDYPPVAGSETGIDSRAEISDGEWDYLQHSD